MARYIANCALPGLYIQNRGIIQPGVEFEVSDDENDPRYEPPRNSFIPVDEAAKRAFAKWNAKHPNDKRRPRPFNPQFLPTRPPKDAEPDLRGRTAEERAALKSFGNY